MPKTLWRMDNVVTTIVAYIIIATSTAMIIDILVVRGENFPPLLFWSALSPAVALLFVGIETAKSTLQSKKEVS